MLKVLKFIKARLVEPSTWASVSTAMIAGAALDPPWAYGAAVAAFMTAFIPTTKTPTDLPPSA